MIDILVTWSCLKLKLWLFLFIRATSTSKHHLFLSLLRIVFQECLRWTRGGGALVFHLRCLGGAWCFCSCWCGCLVRRGAGGAKWNDLRGWQKGTDSQQKSHCRWTSSIGLDMGEELIVAYRLTIDVYKFWFLINSVSISTSPFQPSRLQSAFLTGACLLCWNFDGPWTPLRYVCQHFVNICCFRVGR